MSGLVPAEPKGLNEVIPPESRKDTPQQMAERQLQKSQKLQALVKDLEIKDRLLKKLKNQNDLSESSLVITKAKKPKRVATEKQKKHLLNARAVKAVYRKQRAAAVGEFDMSKLDKVRQPLRHALDQEGGAETVVADYGAGGKFNNRLEFHTAFVKGHPATIERGKVNAYRDDDTMEARLARNKWDTRRIVYY